MKQLYSLLLVLWVGQVCLQAQRFDPYSTPPGAPIFEHAQDDPANRLIPNHPGNAGQRVAVSNFVIIESQSMMVAHSMDVNWRTVLQGMGHNATIYPQTTLDNTAFFASTDALIISSGVIALSPARITTIRQFMQTGKSVYIQGEYLTTYNTNQAFATIMNATGGSCTLGGTVSGDLVPNTVLNAYSSTPNPVTGIGYHWYGATATGCNNMEYFMRYGASNIAYVYCPTSPAYGDVIQDTDQDWVNSLTSIPLMQNIVFALLSGNACTFVCGVLDAQTLDVEATRRPDGSVQLDWTRLGNLQAGTFQVECNDRPIGTVAIGEGAQMVFRYVDARIPSGIQQYTVRQMDMNGTEILRGETRIDLGAAPLQLRIATEDQGFRLWLTEETELMALYLVDAAGKRVSLAIDNQALALGQVVGMQGAAQGVYFIEGITKTGEVLRAKAVWL